MNFPVNISLVFLSSVFFVIAHACTPSDFSIAKLNLKKFDGIWFEKYWRKPANEEEHQVDWHYQDFRWEVSQGKGKNKVDIHTVEYVDYIGSTEDDGCENTTLHLNYHEKDADRNGHFSMIKDSSKVQIFILDTDYNNYAISRECVIINGVCSKASKEFSIWSRTSSSISDGDYESIDTVLEDHCIERSQMFKVLHESKCDHIGMLSDGSQYWTLSILSLGLALMVQML